MRLSHVASAVLAVATVASAFPLAVHTVILKRDDKDVMSVLKTFQVATQVILPEICEPNSAMLMLAPTHHSTSLDR